MGKQVKRDKMVAQKLWSRKKRQKWWKEAEKKVYIRIYPSDFELVVGEGGAPFKTQSICLVIWRSVSKTDRLPQKHAWPFHPALQNL